jgi:outer membrane receptor protein involved in Fe transport
VELEADLRPTSRLTLTLFSTVTSSHFHDTPKQPAIEGNRVPQVPRYQAGAGVTWIAPEVVTIVAQARFTSAQFEDDLNTLTLRRYAVVDASATRPLIRGVHAFFAVENLFDTEYDTGRTPLRTIGWPRTMRVGLRVFLP